MYIKLRFVAAMTLFIFVTFVETSCGDDDGSEINFFVVGQDRYVTIAGARIGEPLRMQNIRGEIFYRHQIRFFDNGYSRADNLITGRGSTVTLWFHTAGEAIEPMQYVVDKDAPGHPGQLYEGMWLEDPSGSGLFLVDGRGTMEIGTSGDMYTISYDLELQTKQLPAPLKGHYEGELNMIPD